ncbi:MAG: cytochrome c3 family protein, partial [Thermodesulfovibrionales bacterium]|nr:cytochrome c3 family protein [Thermodesulfovibrionales bacterium]
VEGLGPVTFSHKFHAGTFPCDECHPKLFGMKKTQGKMPMDKINEGKFCGACHNGSIASPATDCTKCHKG